MWCWEMAVGAATSIRENKKGGGKKPTRHVKSKRLRIFLGRKNPALIMFFSQLSDKKGW